MDLKEFSVICLDKAYKEADNKNWGEAKRLFTLLLAELTKVIKHCEAKLLEDD